MMANPMLIQKQIKDNADDLHNFVRDLKLWEEEMKRKDRQLSTDRSNEEVLPPVRRSKFSSKRPKSEVVTDNKNKRIPSYDYKRWDNFDVEKACEDVDNEGLENEEEDLDSNELTDRYLMEKALYEKQQGNKHVSAGQWDAAVESYTRAIKAYPIDPIFYANRALCYLKKKEWEAVERDCTEALKLDTTYVKAYLRRAVAREALGRLEDTKHDLSQVLRLEPGHSQARRDLQRLKEMEEKKMEKEKQSVQSTSQRVNDQKESVPPKPSTSQAARKAEKESLNRAASVPVSDDFEWEPCRKTIESILKLPHLRSKKSLKRIEIHDIGLNVPKHVCKKNIPKQKEPVFPELPNPINPMEVKAELSTVAKPRSILTLPRTREVPPPPKTSVQFHMSWSTIKNDSHLCYKFLKQITGEQLAEIFKESLESQMFSKIVETLATQSASGKDKGLVLSYLRGFTTVRRFSTLTLFLSPADKSNLAKLFEHCIMEGECPPSEIDELQKKYEM